MMKVIIGELDLTFPIFISKDNHRRIYSSGVPIIEEERYWSKYADRLFWKMSTLMYELQLRKN